MHDDIKSKLDAVSQIAEVLETIQPFFRDEICVSALALIRGVPQRKVPKSSHTVKEEQPQDTRTSLEVESLITIHAERLSRLGWKEDEAAAAIREEYDKDKAVSFEVLRIRAHNLLNSRA